MKIDLEGVEAGVVEEFLRGRHVKEVLAAQQAMVNQQALNAQSRLEHRSVEGLGAPTMTMDATAFHYWRRREGPQFYKDRTWRRYAREAGMQFIRAKGTRVQVGWRAEDGGRPSEIAGASHGLKKFVKVYAG